MDKPEFLKELEFFRGLLETLSLLARLRQVYGVKEDLRPLALRVRAQRHRLRFWSPL